MRPCALPTLPRLPSSHGYAICSDLPTEMRLSKISLMLWVLRQFLSLMTGGLRGTESHKRIGLVSVAYHGTYLLCIGGWREN